MIRTAELTKAFGHGNADVTEPTDQVKSLIDAASLFTAFGAFFEMLPAIAALFSIIWTGMRIIEMVSGKPISKLFGRGKSI